MQEVRAREEEYDFVKAVTLQVLGLPDKTSLARRERRLLHYGPILWLRSAADEHGNTTPIAPAVQLNGKTLIRSVSRSERSNEDAAQRTSRLASAIHNWHIKKARPGSISSSTSSSLSLRSYPTTSSNTTHSSAAQLNDAKTESIPIHAFIFCDLMLLASSGSKPGLPVQESEEEWHLLEDMGLSRVLSVSLTQEGHSRSYFHI